MPIWAPPPARYPNLVLNPEFLIAQRGAGPFTSATLPVNNDDTYLLDGWILLAEGADSVDVSKVTTGLPTGTLLGARSKIRLDVETGNLKFGILHVVEANDARAIIGGVASLSLKAQYVGGTSISTCRAAILAWSSTADTVTSDVVSSWDATDAGVTLVANWTLEGSVTFTPTTSWAEYKVENVAIDTASAANVAVFIWADDTTATTVGEFLEITDVNLVAGPIATPIVRRSMPEELTRSKRFYHRVGGVTNQTLVQGGVITSTTAAVYPWFWDEMRATPTVGIGTVSGYSVGGTALVACTNLTSANAHAKGTTLTATVAAGLTAGQSAYLYDNGGNGILDISAEL